MKQILSPAGNHFLLPGPLRCLHSSVAKEQEGLLIPNCRFVPIKSLWGHRAGDPHRPGQQARSQVFRQPTLHLQFHKSGCWSSLPWGCELLPVDQRQMLTSSVSMFGRCWMRNAETLHSSRKPIQDLCKQSIYSESCKMTKPKDDFLS